MPSAATWMDLENITLRETSQRRQILYGITSYVESKKCKRMYVYNRNRHTKLTENKLIVTKGEMKQGDTKWGKCEYMKQISN